MLARLDLDRRTVLAGVEESHKTEKFRRLWALALFLLSMATAGRAQVPQSGTITGQVLGPGGVEVPGATIQVVDLQSGERKATWTDEDGNYTLAGLAPGNYRLEASLVGFRTNTREPILVTSEGATKVDVALTLALPESNGSSGARHQGGRPSEPGNLQRLPDGVRARLNGLDNGGSPLAGNIGPGDGNVRFSEEATGGSASPTVGDPSAAEGETSPSDAGASAANSFLLSGSVGRAVTPEGDEGRMRERFRERIGEFRRGGGGQFGGGGGFGGGFEGGGGGMFIFFGGKGERRSQVNRVHGRISEDFSNSALDARNYPLNAPSSPQTPAYRERLSFTIGGPLVIPKIYHGKDKTSFFVSYNLQRSRNPFDNYYTVPTPAERSGDFSQAVIPSGPLAGSIPTIFDPSSNPRTPFNGNRISSFDPAAAGLLQFIPLPNLPGSVQNFHLREALPSRNDSIMGRIGHRISPKDNINTFYVLNLSHSNGVSNSPALTRTSSGRSQNLNLGEMHTFSPHVLNNLMFNFNRDRNSTLNPFAFQQNISGQLGILGISQDPRDWGVPSIGFTNFAGLNDTLPSLTRNQTFRVVDFFIYNRGKHNLRFGGETRKIQLNSLTNPDARGTFTFTGYTTSGFDARGLPQPGTGFDFADFLLGLPQTTSARFGVPSNYLRSSVYNAFVQDDWRFSSKLTLNLGARYEYFAPFTEKYGHLSDLEIGPDFSSVSVVTGQSPGPFPSSLIRSNSGHVSPRAGVAFRPWVQHKLVFRAGYGIFFDSSVYQRLVVNLINQPPFAQASTLHTNLTQPDQTLTLENGFPQVAPSVLRNTYAVDPNFHLPYGQSWNFGLEDEIARNVVFSATYTGTKGTKLDLLLGPNRFDARNQLAIRNAQQFTYETSGASSIYNGLQVGLRRQYHGGFSMGGNYTFSKSIDNAAGVGGAGRIVAQDLDLRAERGLSGFDVRHRLTLNHVYEFPFGERRRYLNHGGALAKVLDDWQVGGDATMQSGTPLTARVLGNQSGAGGIGAYFAGRAEATGLPVGLPGFQQSTLEYFNTGAFTLPPAGQFGNAGRNTITGPRAVQFNMSLNRSVTFSREKRIGGDFRIEANNVSNTPTYAGLGTVVNGSDFGRVTSVRSMRTLNFSIRFRF